jgi:hypothetical protein
MRDGKEPIVTLGSVIKVAEAGENRGRFELVLRPQLDDED